MRSAMIAPRHVVWEKAMEDEFARMMRNVERETVIYRGGCAA